MDIFFVFLVISPTLQAEIDERVGHIELFIEIQGLVPGEHVLIVDEVE